MTAINMKALDLSKDAGLITGKSYAAMKNKAEHFGHISRAENMPRPSKSERNRLASHKYAADDTAEGITNTANIFQTFSKNINDITEAAERNVRINTVLPDIKKRVEDRKIYYNNELSRIKDAQRKATKNFEKAKLERDIKFVNSRLKTLDQFYIDPVPAGKLEHKVLEPRAAASKASKVSPHSIEYRVDGVSFDMKVPDGYQYIFEHVTDIPGVVGKTIKEVNNFANTFKTGWLAPSFSPVAYVYGMNEILPSMLLVSKEMGKPLKAHQILLAQAKELKDSFVNQTKDWMIERQIQGKSIFGNTVADIKQFEMDLDEIANKKFFYNASDVNQAGEFIRGKKNLTGGIPLTDSNLGKAAAYSTKAWNWASDTAPVRFLKMISDSTREASSMAIINRAEYLFPGDPETARKFVQSVNKYTSDTRRMGAGGTATADLLNGIQNYMPYGRSIIQGMYGKSKYLNISENLGNFKADMRRIAQTTEGWDYGSEVLMRIGTEFGSMMGSEAFDMMYKLVVMPTALVYAWNHINQDNANDYAMLTDYEKSNRHILTNFLGKGRHMYLPLDQEWAVLSNVAQASIDCAFGLSKNDEVNPVGGYNDQIVTSLGRSLGVELPTIGEAAVNMMGHKTDFTADPLLSENDMIRPITSYDGARYKGGSVSSEVAEVLGTLAGSLGRFVVKEIDDVPSNSLFSLPFVSSNFNTTSRNETANFVDMAYEQNRNHPALQMDMKSRRKIERDLRVFLQTGLREDGTPYGMPRQEVIDTMNENMAKLNAKMYYNLSSDPASLE